MQPDKVVDGCGRYLNLAFLPEDVGNLPVRPSESTQLANQLAVRLKPGARTFLRETLNNFSKLLVYGFTSNEAK